MAGNLKGSADVKPAVIQPALMSERDAAFYCGISQTTLRGLGLPRRMLGSRRLYDRRDLDDFVSGLPYENEREAACRDADEIFGSAG